MPATPYKIGAATAFCTFVAELTISTAVSSGAINGLPIELAAIVDGAVLGVCVSVAYFLLADRLGATGGKLSFPGRVVDAFTIAVLTLGFEGALHTPVDAVTARLPVFFGTMLDATIIAIIVGCVAAWLIYVRKQVGIRPSIQAVGASLIAGAVLAAIYLSAIPALSVFNNMMAWERQSGAARLINLAGRQRMLSQQIGRLALLESPSEGRPRLSEAITTAAVEGRQVDSFATDFLTRFLADGDQGAALKRVAELKAMREDYLSTARVFYSEPRSASALAQNAILQKKIDEYLPEIDLGVAAIQRLADGYSNRQSTVIPIRLSLGTVVFFMSALGLIWPILLLVAAQKAKLEERRRQAEAAAEAKTQFLANMSHELRSPLTAVIGFADLLAEQPDLNAQSRSMIKRITFGGETLLATINDVLDFSSVEAGRTVINARPTEIRGALEQILSLFEGQAATKSIILGCQGIDLLPERLTLDWEKTRQITVNLLGNAMKFTETGRVDLVTSYNTAASTLTISINDTGPGIDAVHLNKLFQRFSQIDGSSTRKQSGSGLGLAICKGLAEAMGGQVGVKSKPGEGSTFWICIPAPIPESVDDFATEAADIDECRIVIAGQSSHEMQMLCSMLQEAGCETSFVQTCAELTAVTSTRPFDVIAINANRFDVDARRALAAIRQSGALNHNVPVLEIRNGAVTDAGSAGLFDGSLSPPFSIASVVGEIVRVIGQGGDIAGTA